MKDWYLLDGKHPSSIGGYENQSFVDYKEDAFLESLTTDIADTVYLYNHDLSTSHKIRGIIQGNTAETYLKSMERCILVPIGTLHSGDYILFENEYWIVNGRPGNNKIYEKAVLLECQYKLRWQRDNGTIIERWANFTSASKYDTGEYGGNVLTLGSNNFTIIIPYDYDGMSLEEKRVFIDTSNKPKRVFKITRNDDVLYIHGEHGGTLSFIADKTEFDKDKDNPDLKLCDYITPTPPPQDPPHDIDETSLLKATISGNKEIKLGFNRSYTVSFMDQRENDVDWNTVDFSWNVVSEFSDSIEQMIEGNKITLYVEDDELLDEKFKLQVSIDDIVVGEIIVNITEPF